MEPVDGAQRRRLGSRLRECLLTTLVLYSLAPCDASAGEQPQSFGERLNSAASEPARARLAAQLIPAPFAFSAPRAETQVFSPTEFRPRKPGLLEAETARRETSAIDAPMLRDTSIAHVMSESKNQDRVRLLTLWQSQASTLSLQAGKGGAPSLQWSSPWMHRDATSHGLFDRLLPVSPRGLGGLVRSSVPRPAGAITPPRSMGLDPPINNN